MKTFQTGVSLSTLPANFRDAIHVTRALDFQYIWIDSLCIIQGPDGDWQEEAPVMNLVYKNAVLSLASAASPEAAGGFFRERDSDLLIPPAMSMKGLEKVRPKSTKPEALNGSQSHAADESLEPVDELGMFYAVRSRGWITGVIETPLNRRAWVLQETVLAHRTVYFGNNLMFWNCRELKADETFPGGLPMEDYLSEAASLKFCAPDTLQRARESANGAVEMDLYRKWEMLVEQYTLCGLTNPKDKLVAISGLAKEFSWLLNDEYVAGMWRNRIVKELIWREIRTASHKQAQAYRAPTWSWAPVNGPIQFSWASGSPKVVEMDYIEIIDVKCQPLGDDLTGEIQSGVIRLRGYLIPASEFLEKRPLPFGTSYTFDGGVKHIESTHFLPVALDNYSLRGLILQDVSEAGFHAYKRFGVMWFRSGTPLDNLGLRKHNGYPPDEKFERGWIGSHVKQVDISIL